MIEWLWKGGPVMIPIAVCSVVALAATIERFWSLRRERVVPQGFCVELIELLRQERYADALTACRKRDSAISRILEVAIEARHEPRSMIKERVEEVGRREAADLERYLGVVALIGSIGPLLGLLGTVSGMIRTFDAIESGGIGRMEFVAGGISEALITTLFGLAVAIPAVMAHRYLAARVDGLLVDMEEVSIGVVDLLVGERAREAAK
ncbi:MAG: MotA/TolQ/ExbB proton channel family protein [Myxococcota bacterium]